MPHDKTSSTTSQFDDRLAPARRRGGSRGQSLVEMALIAPVMVTLLFGIIEMGRIFFAWLTTQHAARTGTRFAVTGMGEQEGTRMKQILQTVRKAAESLSESNLKIVIRSWPQRGQRRRVKQNDPGGPCDFVEVEVRYRYQPAMPLFASLMPEQLILRGRDRKRNEPWALCDQ